MTQTLTVPEGGSNSYMLVLGSRPTGDVSVSITGQAGTDLSLSSDMLTFTTGNWDTAQTVTVSAAEDDDGVTDDVATLTHTASGGGYDSTALPDVEVSITENDTPGLVISKDNLAVVEGDAGGTSYTVALATKPTAGVSVSVTGHTGTDLSLDKTALTFTTGNWNTAQTVTVTAAQDDDAASDVATLTHTASGGDYANLTRDLPVTVTDDDTQVTVKFGADTYTVSEGNTATITVTLSADPQSTVIIPLEATGQNGATSDDYHVPSSVTINGGETSKTFDFMAMADDASDDGESVMIGFGTNLPSRVTKGTPEETMVSIRQMNPQLGSGVTVQFEADAYTVSEGGTATITVTLSADPQSTVVIPITATNQGGATSSDYSIVSSSVTFNSGDTSQTITFSATEDMEDELGESVLLAFGPSIPSGVSAGTPSQTTVSIIDGCDDGDIWCATLNFSMGSFDSSERLNVNQIDTEDFLYDSVDYQLIDIRVIQNGHHGGDDVNVQLPFGIPERTKWSMDFRNLNSGTGSEQFEILTEDWRDWTLHVSTVSGGDTLTAALRFSEASYTGQAWWWWFGRDIDHMRRVWQPGQLYKVRLIEDPRSERPPQPLNPPMYLRVKGVMNTNQVYLSWLAPQARDDQVPPVDRYKIQFKQSSGSWDTAADVTEVTGHHSRRSYQGHFLVGLTPGDEYNIRVVATDSVGDSKPSNEITYTMPADAHFSLSNTPAGGQPRIDGTPEAGQTLTADASGITEYDGLNDVVFQYQWLVDDSEIVGATGSTYTLTSDDEGSAITVRVDFTDDAGNEESLTSAPTVVTSASLELRSATMDGAMLTLTYNEVLGNLVSVPQTAFAVNVNGDPRSVGGVGFGESNVLLFLSSAVEAGDTVTVDYTAPDDTGFIKDILGRKADSLTGQVVTNNTDLAPLTASAHDVPSSHNGQDAFIFELRLSDAPKPNFSYTTVRDHAFTVTGGSVTYVRRLEPGKNLRWEIHVTPGSGADVAIALNATTNCSAEGAICTGDGRMLSGGPLLVVPGPNTPATGTPTISGTAQVGETLTADTTDISDHDGLANAIFVYQWLADDGEIDSATASTYTLVATDVGNAIKVRVSFTDDAGNDEELTSAGTAAVAAAPPLPNTPAIGLPTISGTAQVGETLTADTTGISDGDGLYNATFAYQWLADDAEINGATASTYTLVATDEGNAIKVRVSFTDDAGSDEELTSAATGAVVAAPPPPNTPATGVPTISGTAQVGETLTADITSISDDDGLTNASFGYQWLADDVEINGATANSYTLTDTEAGKTIKVLVSFTDDAGNDEELTSAATGAVAAAVVKPPLTATVHGVPSSHNGQDAFTFELRFSEAPKPDFSYTTVRDHAFTVTGGSVTYVRRLEAGKNVRWEVTVTPDSSADVSIDLNATTDCEAVGAICTSDGKRLSASVSAIVSGPDSVGTVPVAVIVSGTTPVAEGEIASFTISLNRAAPTALSVAVSVADAGGVLSGTAPSSVAFATGDNSKTITLSTRDDNAIKTASTVTVSLATGSGYTLGMATSASVSVTDNDTAAWTVEAQPTEIAEGGSSTITLGVANGKTFAANQTLSLAVSGSASGSDYRLSATELTLQAGASSVTATVTARDDTSVESDETVIVTATHDGQPIGSATVTIEDNDTPVWSVVAEPAKVAEGEVSTVTVSVDKAFAVAQTITLAVTGGTAEDGDYLLSSSLTLGAGDTSVMARVTAVDDSDEESDETVVVTASHGGGAVGSATVIIEANDTPVSSDAALSSLALSGVDIGGFDADNAAYAASVGNGVSSTTVTAVASDDGASVVIADGDGETRGTSRSVSLVVGDNAITVTVTAEDAVTTKTYTITVTRAEPDVVPLPPGVVWGDRLPDRDIALPGAGSPSGVWSDGTDVWVVTTAGKISVYSLADGSEHTDRGFTLPGRAEYAAGLWSDGATLWVADVNGGWVRAYRLSDGARQADRDLAAAAGNSEPTGIWSDGATMWVADYTDSRVYAYDLTTKARVADKEFDLTKNPGETYNPYGIWSNGHILWVLDSSAATLYAYAVPGLGAPPNDTAGSGD